jgi:hypothetical protein
MSCYWCHRAAVDPVRPYHDFPDREACRSCFADRDRVSEALELQFCGTLLEPIRTRLIYAAQARRNERQRQLRAQRRAEMERSA